MSVEDEALGGEALAPEPTLRESLASALSSDGDGVAQTGTSVAAPAAEVKPAITLETGVQASTPDRSRAADGKFAPKDTKTSDQSGAPVAGAQAQPEPTRAPASWSAAAKAKFPTLDPVIQQEIGKRERDIDKGLQDRARELDRYKPIEQVIAPVRERLAIAGVSEAQYFGALIAADNALRDPNRAQAALAQLAQQYAIRLPQAGPGQQQQPHQAPVHPTVARLQQQVQALTQSQQQQAQATTEAHQRQLAATIDAFAADPKHVYFENVRDDMGVLMRSGKATSLDEAYDMACHMRPDIRSLVAGLSGAGGGSDAARQRAAAARQASGSVVGAPGPGSAAQGAAPNLSIRDTLKQAMREAS